MAFVAVGRPVLPTRFGLHAGEAMVGSGGAPDRLNYTALVHSVNVAARVVRLNEPYGTRILVIAAVREAAGEAVAFRHLASPRCEARRAASMSSNSPATPRASAG